MLTDVKSNAKPTFSRDDRFKNVQGKLNQKLVDHLKTHQTESPAITAEKFGVKRNTIYWYRNYINRKLGLRLERPVGTKHQYHPSMKEKGRPNPNILQHIRENPEEHPHDLAKKFGITVSTAYTYRGVVRKEGIDIPKAKKRYVKPEEQVEQQVKREDTHDAVNHPAHYTAGGIEAIEYIEAKLTPEEFAGYCKGNALKYMSRAGKKDNSAEDLAKARWYLDRLLTVRGA